MVTQPGPVTEELAGSVSGYAFAGPRSRVEVPANASGGCAASKSTGSPSISRRRLALSPENLRAASRSEYARSCGVVQPITCASDRLQRVQSARCKEVLFTWESPHRTTHGA